MMFPIPCDRSVRCFPCADEASNPLANLSTEDPDTNLFLSVSFRRQSNPPPNNWNQDSCVGFCESAISQEDADDCARREAFDCIINHQGPPNPTNTSWPTPTYCNQEMTCQKGDECYTIPSGAVCDFSQAEADALAQSFCNYRVHDASLTGPCVVPPPEPPDPPPIPPELVCPQESGAAAPDTLEITSPQLWESHAIDRSVLVPFTSGNPACNPTNRSVFVPNSPIDHPPGIYGMAYVSGYFQNLTTSCVPPEPYPAIVHIRGLENEEYNYDSSGFCGGNTLAHVISTLPPGSGSNQGSGFSGCFVDAADAQSELTIRFENRLYMPFSYPPDEVNDFPHSNIGGNFRLLIDDNIMELAAVFPAGPMTWRVHQFEGLIPQPRKLAIDDYNNIKLHFADQAAGNAWDGTFPERTVYNSMTVQWATTGAGAFGGSVVRSTDAHPTSANGKGWMLEVFSPGAILMYRAFKAVGSTSIGIYFKDSTSTPLGPACVTCSDDSDTAWEPP